MDEESLPSDDVKPPGSLASSDDYQGSSVLTLIRPIVADPVIPPQPVRPTHPPRSRITRLHEGTHAFRRRFFPGATPADWNDWVWQLQNRITTVERLADFVQLAPDETQAIEQANGLLPFGITPYYLSLLDPRDPTQPLRRSVVPTAHELVRGYGEADDPLHEEHDSPVPGLVHRYPDRALFLVTDYCSTYCRYCTRSRMVGASAECTANPHRWERAIAYIEANPAIRDVILSGGDPLTLPDHQLEWLLQRVRRIPHVEILRIGTKVPAVLPQRITPALVRMLRQYHPLFMSLHFTHPDEMTPETRLACGRLADAGIPLGSQTVLLAGINDDVTTMSALMHRLLQSRVRPYYLYQCDPIPGSGHFRTSVARGVEIIRGLRGHTSGYAVPAFVIDAPGGGGKVPVQPDYVLGRDGADLMLTNYANGSFRYPDPKCSVG